MKQLGMKCQMSLTNLLEEVLPELELSDELSPQEAYVRNADASITSTVWKGGKFRRARLCDLYVPGKFTAETLVIYPEPEYDFPIFGCEYLTIGQSKFFGAVDFHPISKTQNYARDYLAGFPDTTKTDSKFYNLSEFFSPKFWIEKRGADFYAEYIRVVEEYLYAYKLASDEAKPIANSMPAQVAYDTHMAVNDPAWGILKVYFSSSFAEHYINNFLFKESKQ